MIARRRSGKIHGVSSIQFMLLVLLTLAEVIGVGSKVFSVKDNEKHDFLLKKKKQMLLD